MNPSHDILIGTQIGNYRLVRFVAKGGMGAVYEAANEHINQRVAIKVLSPDYAGHPEFVARLMDEARAVNIVSHASLVKVFDHGQLADGRVFLLMEYLEGEPLRRRLKQEPGGLPLGESLRLCRQIASALAAVHVRGIVHRDLKPENVMIVPDPEAPTGARVKVLDFGIARFRALAAGTDRQRWTKAGGVMGTPRYMAPEQGLEAREVTDRADVYALGIMLYEMLVGRPPFVESDIYQMINKHITEDPPPLREADPRIPEEVADLVHAMLQKQPELRPAMADVESRLRILEADDMANPVPPTMISHDLHFLADVDTKQKEPGPRRQAPVPQLIAAPVAAPRQAPLDAGNAPSPAAAVASVPPTIYAPPMMLPEKRRWSWRETTLLFFGVLLALLVTGLGFYFGLTSGAPRAGP
jgi:serine/threonine protein kinase